jgi:hypothetical protein
MNTTVFTIQVLSCAQTLVGQTAVVDAQSRQLLALEPDITKATSAWAPGPAPLLGLSETSGLMDWVRL